MRHLSDKTYLNRSASHRKAMAANMAAALFLHRKIETTLGKARYARRFAERMITFARKGDLAARRHVSRYIRNREALKKLFDELGPHFKNRDGGYTRIIHLGTRKGDAAEVALLELVGFDDAVAAPQKSKPSKSRMKKDAGAAEPAAEPAKPPVKKAAKAKEEPAEVAETAVEEVNSEETAPETTEAASPEATESGSTAPETEAEPAKDEETPPNEDKSKS